MKKLLLKIGGCTECSEFLELGPRPIVTAHAKSKIVVIGQAPGSIVHKTGIPWDDKSGENLRKKECAPLWHQPLFDKMKEVKLILLIGKYAQDYYLKEKAHKTLTATVQNYSDYLPEFFVLPHPSPRNNIWMKKNEWFKKDLLPQLAQIIQKVKGT